MSQRFLNHSSPPSIGRFIDVASAGDLGYNTRLHFQSPQTNTTTMIRASQPSSPDPREDLPAATARKIADSRDHPSGNQSESGPYGSRFWLCYLANTSLMVAMSLMFRHADFVTFLGGSELHLGQIVGAGAVGGLLMRWWQSRGIDRHGPKTVWLWSLGLMLLSLAGHLAIVSLASESSSSALLVSAAALRIPFAIAVAGAFGASITYISQTVPAVRVAEIVGTLGSSGFVGLFLGPVIGDWIFRGGQNGRSQVTEMFVGAIALVSLSFVAAVFTTRGQVHVRPRRRPPLLWLLRRYNPGWILLVGVAMGIGVGLPGTFLVAYTGELGIEGIKLFFQVYAGTAFVVRMACRRFPERFGVRRMILVGLCCLTTSLLLYLVVDRYAMLAVPAVMAGIAHAFLFPAVVAGASTSFPPRYRGLGTTLILAMFDVGVLIGSPMIGHILAAAPQFGLPAYPTMFLCVAASLALTTAVYYAMGRRAAIAERLPVMSRGEDPLSNEAARTPEEKNSDVAPVSGSH